MIHSRFCAAFLLIIYVLLSGSFWFVHADSNISQAPGAASRFDGPAELPRVVVKSALADTPARGKVISIREGDDFQSAINNADCGDTLQLQAGAVVRGKFRFPEKRCPDVQWIVVRPRGLYSELPPQAAGLTPIFPVCTS